MQESCMDMGVCPTNTNVPRTRKIPHHEAKLQRIELHTNVCTDFFLHSGMNEIEFSQSVGKPIPGRLH